MLLVFLVCGALTALMFSNIQGYEQPLQAAGIGLISLAAAISLGSRRFIPSSLSFFEVASYGAVCASLVAASLGGNDYIAGYTVMFALALASVSVLARSLTYNQLITAAALFYYIAIAAILAFQGGEFINALASNPLTRWENRFTPFGTHPNLTGLIFCGGIIILLSRVAVARRAERILACVCILLCILIDLAASARGSLVAVIFSLAILIGSNLRLLQKYIIPVTVAGLLIGFSVIVVYPNELWNYISTMLELNSATRGFDSGGSGRVDIWARGLNFLINRDFESLFGSGLRSSTVEMIGFSTESSYITILIESGVVFGGAQIAAIVLLAFRNGSAIRNPLNSLDRALIIFFLLQSIFNRYLIAIGNPFSVLFLLLVVHIASVRRRSYASRRLSSALAAGRLNKKTLSNFQ